MANQGTTTEPDMDNHQTYLELGEIQNNVYRQLEGIFDDQYEFARRHPLN